MKRGFFITFEGIDGCGKTTQLNLAKQMLENKGYDVVVTKEPGCGDVGNAIRNIVLHNKTVIADKCEMFLFLADRAQHIETLIKPSISEGKIVLCDRHTDSTLAYQGFGRNGNTALLKQLNDIATGDIKPDLTLFFDVSTETSAKRVGKEKDRMESCGNDFMQNVRKGYIELYKSYPERIKKIDAEKSIDDVFAETKKYIEQLIEKAGK